MTADASAFQEKLPLKDIRNSRTPEVVDIDTRFSRLRQRVAARIGGIKAGFEALRRPLANIKTEDIQQVDLRQERKELDALLRNQGALDEKTALAIRTESTPITETSQIPDPLTAIKILMSEPVSKPLSRIDGATKTTRFLEREGRKWKDGIQVLRYHDDADTNEAASIENFALETDAKGRIIGRKSLHVMKDGTYTIRDMKMTGRRWVGRTRAATEHDVTQAIQAVDQLHVAEMSQYDERPDNGNKVAVPSDKLEPVARAQLPDTESEIPYRREHIQAFAMKFLHTLNPDNISQDELYAFFADRDIFAGLPTEEVPDRISFLRGYEDMFALIKYYDNNLDTVPKETIVMTDQQTVEPFDDKVLFYIQETEHSAFLRGTLPRPKNDVLQFEGEEGKRRPDVYIKSVDDIAIEEKRRRRGKTTRTQTKKESFSIRGCDAVIIGGQIRSDIPTLDISCNGTVTVLPEASLTPAPPEGRTTISVETRSDVVLSENSTLSASAIRCDNFRLEGGQIVNPHPNERRVEVACKRMVDSNERPLDPRLFHVMGDDDYIARQIAIAEVVYSTKLGISKDEGQKLEAMDRSEYVSEFAVKFLKALNPTADKDRIAMELFARGAPGTVDASILYGNLDENIARWKAEEARPLEERTLLFRGVEDMLRLVEYYRENPGVELPSQVFVLRNETDIPEHVRNNPKKTLIYWSETWEQADELIIPNIEFLGRDIGGSIPTISKMNLTRPQNEAFIFEGDKKPDLFISSMLRPKRNLSLQGFDTIIVNANVQATYPDIACSGELKLYPNSSLEAFSEFSSVRAGIITQEGNFGVAEIRCKTFRRENGDISNPEDEGLVKLVCEEYIGEPPDPEVVDLITSISP